MISIYQNIHTGVDNSCPGYCSEYHKVIITLHLFPLPDVMVTIQPLNQTNVLPGRTANFTITAAGAGSISYQWQYGNGTNLLPGGRYQGTTTPTLVITPVVVEDDSSVYVCRVTSPSGNTTTTQPAYLTLGELN